MTTAQTVEVALLYHALKSLDITRLFSAWNDRLPAGDEQFTLTTELCGSTARIARGEHVLEIEAHMLPRTGETFSNVLSGSPDRAQLATIIAGHHHHVTVTASGAPVFDLLQSLRDFAALICTMFPPEAVHWTPATRLFTTTDFLELNQTEAIAPFLMRAAESGSGIKLIGAEETLGHEMRVFGGDLPFEVAEAMAFAIAEKRMTGWEPAAAEVANLKINGQTYPVRLGMSSDNTLCLRPDTVPAGAPEKPCETDRKRVTKLALILQKASDTVPGMNGHAKPIDAAPASTPKPKPRKNRSRDDEALKAVFRPASRLSLSRWRRA